MHLLHPEIYLTGLFYFLLQEWARVHLQIRVCHVDHFYDLLYQDDEHEDVDDQGEPRTEPGLVGIAASIIEREGVAEAVSPEQKLCEAWHFTI